MSVSNVNGVGRVVLPATANRNPGTPEPTSAPASVREPSAGPDGNSLVQIDDATNQPIPPRYPWLSRLARELEPVSKQPSPYGTVELLGEKLDKQA